MTLRDFVPYVKETMEDKELELVFVYGTLKIGERNNHYLNGFECVDENTRTKDNSFIMQETESFSSPGNTSPIVMMNDSNQKDAGAILGQVFAVTPEGLSKLDALEGYYSNDEVNSDYLRKKIFTENAQEVWMYFLNPDKSKIVISQIEHVDFDVDKREYNWI